jgi:hypothetical protein
MEDCMFASDPLWWAKRFLAAAAFCITTINLRLFAADDLTILECQRRSPFTCTAGEFGPHSGIFVVDTGFSSSATFYPARFRESPEPGWHFGETHGQFTIGSGSLPFVENIRISTFGNVSEKTRLFLIEKPAKSLVLLGVDGILGLSEMREMAIRIDLKKQVAARVDSPWQPTAGFVKATLERRRRLDFRLPVTIASSVELPMMVDTGCWPFMLMQTSTLKFQAQLGNAVPARRVNISTATEVREAQTYLLKSITICGFEFRDIEVQEANFEAIGIGCLSHFDVVLDFPYNEIWLAPHSSEWPKSVPPEASGLFLAFLDTNVLTVFDVQKDSPASKSLLQVDDQILLFDGKEPKDLSMMEIHQRKTEAGTILPLRVKRGDRVFDVQLPLGYSFEYPPKWPNKKNVLDEFGEFLEKDAKSPASEHVVPHK